MKRIIPIGMTILWLLLAACGGTGGSGSSDASQATGGSSSLSPGVLVQHESDGVPYFGATVSIIMQCFVNGPPPNQLALTSSSLPSDPIPTPTPADPVCQDRCAELSRDLEFGSIDMSLTLFYNQKCITPTREYSDVCGQIDSWRSLRLFIKDVYEIVQADCPDLSL